VRGLRFAWVKSWSGKKYHVASNGRPRRKEASTICNALVSLSDLDDALVLGREEVVAYEEAQFEEFKNQGYHWSYFTSPFCIKCWERSHNVETNAALILERTGEGWHSPWYQVAECLYCHYEGDASRFYRGLCHTCHTNSWRYIDAIKKGVLLCSVCGVNGAKGRGHFPGKRSGTKVVVPYDMYCKPCYRRQYQRAYRTQKRLEELKQLQEALTQARGDIKWRSKQLVASALS